MASLAVVRETAPSRHRGQINITEVVTELRHQNRKATDERIAERLLEQMDEDHDLMRAAAGFIVERVVLRQHVSPKARAERQVAEKAAVRAIAGKVRETVLLDLVMPNGAAMRFNTGTQMGAYGKAYEKIAERAGAAMVGEVMVESEVKALLCLGV
jgi:hypothetical protein